MGAPQRKPHWEETTAQDHTEFVDHPKSLFFIGGAHIILGVVVLSMPILASFTIELILGSVFIASGLAHLVHATQQTNSKDRFTSLLFCLLNLGIGTCFLVFSSTTIPALMSFAAFLFIFIGAFRLAEVFNENTGTSQFWTLTSSLTSLLIGGLILYELPFDAYWILGIIVGIDLVIAGVHYLAWNDNIKLLNKFNKTEELNSL